MVSVRTQIRSGHEGYGHEAEEADPLDLVAKALVAIYGQNTAGGANNVEFMFMDEETGVPFTVTLTPFGGKSPAQINNALRAALQSVIANPQQDGEIAHDVLHRFGYKDC